jgi:hypothetical protein
LYVFAICLQFFSFLYYFILIFIYVKAPGIGNPVRSAIHKLA